jgi:acyl carrier protein phosphodiesterase
MNCAVHRKDIVDTFSSVREMSFKEKQSPFMDESNMDAFLDAILDFKKSLVEKTNQVTSLNEGMEKLTWHSKLDDECLMLLNDLISAAKDLRSSLIRQYVSMAGLRSKGIARSEIKAFKNSIDELKENYEDLESVFFYLPEMPGFKETTKKLSLVG